MKKTHKLSALLLISGIAVSATNLIAQVFSDNFESNTSASWTKVFYSTNAAQDFTAVFAFDYGTNQFVRNGVTNTIPSAPNSGGTTKGLKVTVNKDATPAHGSLSLYPNGQNFSGNFSLKFDMWANYNGPAYGGPESTEFVTFGLNHAGDKANSPSNSVSDGVWMMAATEGGTAPDYRAFVGTGFPNDLLESAFFDRDGDGVKELNAGTQNTTNHPLNLIFPEPQFESPGAPGKQWVQAEVRQIDGVVTWLLNGYVFAQTADGNAVANSGNIMLGYIDLFNGVPSPKEDSFVIFDNVRVFSNPSPVVVTVTKLSDASEPSTPGSFRISRTGSTTSALPVPYRVVGNARSGVDFVALSGNATIPAGSSFVDVTVTPLNDNFIEPVENVAIALTSNPAYDVGAEMMALVGINGDGDDTVPVVSVKALRPAYELSKRGTHKGKVEFSLLSALGNDLQVNYTLSGTATNGVHFETITNFVTIPAGATNLILEVLAINDNVVNADRTVIFTLADTSTGTLLIKNDDLTPGTLLFSDAFDTDSSANWTLNRTKPSDPATFAYDYSVTANDIPPAPSTTNGTTKGLKIEVNTVTAGALSGISLSPKNQNFTGDYRLRMDVWINYNGSHMADGGSQSTEWFTAGVGTSGAQTQWYNGGSAVDGIWFGVNGDGGNGQDYRAYRGNFAMTNAAAPGVYAQGTQRAKDAFQTTSGAYSFFGGERPPLGQRTTFPLLQNTPDHPTNCANLGNAGFSWHDMVITKSGGTVTWHMDGHLIATMTTNGANMSSNIFVGSFDQSSGISPEPALQYAIVDNLRVESLTVAVPTAPAITSVARVGSNIQINFTGSTSDGAGAFAVEAKAALDNSPFALEGTASITQLSPGSFRATIPMNGNTRFYRIKR